MADPREPIEDWIDEALVADVMWMRASHPIVFVSPSRSQVRAMIEAVAPLVAAAERKRIREMAVRNGAVCPGDDGTLCYFADLLENRDDEKGPQS